MAIDSRNTQTHMVRRFFSSRLFLILLFVCAFLVAFSYARAYYQDYAIRQEIQRLEEEVRRLEHKKLESFELLNYVTSDEFVEERARVEFNMKKPGEQVVVIQQESMDDITHTSVSSDGEGELLKNPRKWWYYILRKPLPHL